MASQFLLRTARSFNNSRRPASFLKNQKIFKSTSAIETNRHEHETFLTGSSSLYAEQMYENFCADPTSVHETWRKYFEDMDAGMPYNETSFNRPTVVVSNQKGRVEARDSHLAVSQ